MRRYRIVICGFAFGRHSTWTLPKDQRSRTCSAGSTLQIWTPSRTTEENLCCSIRFYTILEYVDLIIEIIHSLMPLASVYDYQGLYVALSSSCLILLGRIHTSIMPDGKRLVICAGLVYHSIFLYPCDTDAWHFWTAWLWRGRAATTIDWRA